MPEFISDSFHNGMTLMIAVLLILVIAYRYYSAFIAAKVLALDPNRPTPAHTLRDGHNYDPTNKWVLFGHHFAAISGAGPLIGPVLAAQFGFLPGLLWILIGVCLAGAVQDFVVLILSTRRDGKSLAQIAYMEIGPIAGTAATLGILFVLIIALAGLGKVIVKALGGETLKYPAGTHFIAAKSAGIVHANDYANVYVYRIPEGTIIRFNNGVESTVGQRFELTSIPNNNDVPIPLEIEVKGKPVGSEIVIKDTVTATRSISGSAWGAFTIFLTIPIALFVGVYMTRFRKGKILEASIIGGILILGAVWLGGLIDNPESVVSSFRDYFNLSQDEIGYAMAIYGFLASILPVSILLCPRILSSFLKIGTVILLVLGVIFAHPHMQAPAINHTFLGGGPIVADSIFPFVFITIMCGAISGFHALVASGTTPKMLNNEKDARTIGYGAMLIEGLVGIVALIAASSLPSAHYYHINTSWEDLPKYQQQIVEIAKADTPAPGDKEVLPLANTEKQVGESLEGRTGGAVTLAVGMAKIFDDAAKNILGKGADGVTWLEGMMPYWYHFAIMFEALFILTTIDAGTRVGRFLLQETMGKWIHPSLGKAHNWPSAIIATTLVVGGWWYFLAKNDMKAVWPMFGIANQMLAVMALGIASVALARSGKGRYAWVTIVPMIFVAITTTSAAVIKLKQYFAQISAGGDIFNPAMCASLIIAISICTLIIVIAGLLKAGVRQPATAISSHEKGQ